ncbi:hypothetical protein HZH68_006365 [Vespula germanica]|uniref:Uncharacterized protein n=1 Tax=Vespula germanica TaxID=30212 RepID=A0A834KD69_VESGE|nr:hypothetical protein HZH68_006365 [Vespula germanica]
MWLVSRGGYTGSLSVGGSSSMPLSRSKLYNYPAQGWVLVVGQQRGSPEQRGCKESEEEKEEEEEEDTGFTSLLVTWKFNGQIGIRRHEADLMRSNSSCEHRLNLTNAHSRFIRNILRERK